jgi:N-acetylglucosaminyldiphosphoundecaprenol N-acetyl-beta-D-mannosaminyltransferase
MHKRNKVLGIRFDLLTYDQLVEYIENPHNREGYICFPDLYSILLAFNNPKYQAIYDQSILTLPDGKPSQIILRLSGFTQATTISGFWLCKLLLNTELSHYFYGTSEINIKKMVENIQSEFPNSRILGYKSPPLVTEEGIIDNEFIHNDMKNIIKEKPDIIWIGISSPKQDILMNQYSVQNSNTIMIGVGAVFDYLAGTAYMGPEWVKDIGLRWLYQLLRNPSRYYKKTLFILSKILILMLSPKSRESNNRMDK